MRLLPQELTGLMHVFKTDYGGVGLVEMLWSTMTSADGLLFPEAKTIGRYLSTCCKAREFRNVLRSNGKSV